MADTQTTTAAPADAAPAPAAVPTAKQLFSKLTVDEATQAVAAVTPSLTALATGDGSATSIMGQWIALQGAILANKSIFQKIGVNDGASALLALVQQLPAFVAAQTSSGTSSGAGAA